MKRNISVMFITTIIGIVLVMYGLLIPQIHNDWKMGIIAFGVIATLSLESMAIIKATKEQ